MSKAEFVWIGIIGVLMMLASFHGAYVMIHAVTPLH